MCNNLNYFLFPSSVAQAGFQKLCSQTAAVSTCHFSKKNFFFPVLLSHLCKKTSFGEEQRGGGLDGVE